ncbi:ABC transporter permease [Aquariibacter albus]|uniref:ABC transporter permease n=1 Tax=Aquariibacter albus TaxID=2759899 RepID=A0A839HNX5_9BURK|nr:ABC transporter permease [Aquariibacter albus]MBB1160691.1 ABC transporter permease [Aquariibacter albus]
MASSAALPPGRSLAAGLMPVAAALLLTLLLFSLAVALAGFRPIEVWLLIFEGGFGDSFAWQNTLQRAAPLILTGLAVALPAQAGRVVIGAEGALVLGGLAAAAVGHGLASAGQGAALVWPAMAVAGALAGAVWIGLVGWLREAREVNETIASLLMAFIALALFNQMVETVLRDPASLNKPSTHPLPDELLLPPLPGLEVHWGLGLGLGLALLAWLVIRFTPLGLALRVAGGNPRAALGVGLPVAGLTIGACAVGGACAGLAGAVEVAAIHGAANASLIAGYGYTGILIAFAARFSPAGVVPVALLVGGIAASGSLLQRRLGLPDAAVTVLLGFAFVALIACESLRGRSFSWKGRARHG